MSTYPPDGYEIGTDGVAVWGTDLDVDTGVYLSGDASVKFKNTSPAGASYVILVSTQSKYVPVQPGDLFLIEGWVRADANGADDHVYGGVCFYNSAKAWQSNADVVDAAVVAADTWERKVAVAVVPAGCYWMAEFSGRKMHGASEFNAYWDALYVAPVEVAFFALLTADTAYASTATIAFNDDTVGAGKSTYDLAGSYDTGTFHFTAQRDGVYLFSAAAYVYGLDAGERAYLVFYRNGAARGFGSTFRAHSNNQGGPINGVFGPVWLFKDDTVEVTIDHDHAGNVTLLGHATVPYTHFCGSLVR